MKKCHIFALGMVTLFLLNVTAVRSAGAEEIEMLIDVFVASEEPGGVSPNLEYIRSQLGNTPFRFNSYRSMGTELLSIPVGGKVASTFSLGWELGVEIEVLQVTDESVSFSVNLRRDGTVILDSNLLLAREGTVLVGGPRLESGVIMIAITERW